MKPKLRYPKPRPTNKKTKTAKYNYLFFDEHPQPMWLFDPETLMFLDVNKAAIEKYGYTRKEFLQMTVPEIRPPEDLTQLETTAITEQSLQPKGEWRHRLKDGRLIIVEVTRHAMELNGKKVVVVVVNDITERKQAERELQESLKRFHDTLDNMLEGCQIIDYDWRYAYINHAAAKHGRRKPDDLLGRTMQEAYPGIENTELFAILSRCMESRVPHLMENKFDNPDGSTGWFELSIQPVLEGLFILSIEITDRKLAEEEIRKQLARVTALRQIDLAILSSFDLDITLTTSINHVAAELGVDAVNVLILNTASNTLDHAAGIGFRSKAIRERHLQIGEGYAGRAILEQRTIYTSNLAEENRPFAQALLKHENFASYFCVPLIIKGQARGVLEIFHRAPLEPDPGWLNFLEVLAGQVAIAIDNSALFYELQNRNSELMLAYETTLEGWSSALDLRDKETEGHTQRVTKMTLDLANAMGFQDEKLIHLRRGALLHDIGKMGVADHILLKPDKLTEAEWTQMRLHPVYAHKLLLHINYLNDAMDIPYCHHEKWDGTGYPRGLKGEQIPLAARIFSVVDVYDALTSDRPYRKGWSREETLEHIRNQSGSQFDPQVVDAFLKMMNTRE